MDPRKDAQGRDDIIKSISDGKLAFNQQENDIIAVA